MMARTRLRICAHTSFNTAIGFTCDRNIAAFVWTTRGDNKCSAEAVTKQISGSGMKQQYSLHNIRTVKQLKLPSQMMNYENSCETHCSLRGLPLRSYSNAVPRLLIGVDNVNLTSALKVRESGDKGLIAVKTRLGWSIYGTPHFAGDFNATVKKAVQEALAYSQNGIDAIMIENMHDIPYIQRKHFGPETVACMTRIGMMVKKAVGDTIPCGIQILACGNFEALAIAKACNFDFVRAEGFVFSHIADEGFTDADAGQILSSHSVTNDVSLLETAQAAEFFCSDGIVLTGNATGSETNVEDVQSLHNKIKLPLIIGSGITIDNVDRYYGIAKAAIVGSFFKHGGNWKNDLCGTKIRTLMDKIKGFRNNTMKK
ncbi:uncharacterized protein F13E9.13, mitochondrial isoform X2 [Toxorhynchites rutilus septentrionalis]|uniref:uncharacterized protein F13E9.13, mitochondrial isoform X2 n=1 Tax=Toxorhynchites rutilus septentrionalis TaxID=329112 RepID=UPI00247A04A4|nr:uncharacterized protein F13E9.13, mitochondrial isoform X2 [Toxorhynchites rutilus septentrionalis]